jgi:hypothetical protein
MIVWFAIASLATYYAARAVSQEDGPFGMFDKLRMRWNAGYLGTGVRCIVCVSAYVALPCAALLVWRLALDPWLAPVVWLGLAGASAKLAEWWKR